MHSPTDVHWNAIKLVIRYLCGTSAHGLLFKKNSTLQLQNFSDSDWAGFPDDR